MRPELILENNNKSVDIYNRHTHFTLECFENGTWRMVKTAKTIEEAKLMAERYVGPSTPTLLNEYGSDC
jgi:hypothetical protein